MGWRWRLCHPKRWQDCGGRGRRSDNHEAVATRYYRQDRRLLPAGVSQEYRARRMKPYVIIALLLSAPSIASLMVDWQFEPKGHLPKKTERGYTHQQAADMGRLVDREVRLADN